jgi:predicted enzyme related to lactoylglutathione lyase
MADLTFVLDCNELDRAATFWSAALDYREDFRGEPYAVLLPRAGPGSVLVLQQVTEPKQGKNRMHMDLHVDAVEPEVERLLTLGATPVGDGVHEEQPFRWQIMADPDGNEFCVCAPLRVGA